MQTVRKNKVSLISTLSTDASFILQYVQQDNIITDREYTNLKHNNHTKEDIVTDLLDTLMNKGDATCCKFVALLKQEEVQEAFPRLQQLFVTDEGGDCYPMTHRPVGYCVIINNLNFQDTSQLCNRRGTDADKDALTEVFERMHFSVEERKDCSSSDMLKVVKEFSMKDHSKMDAFVCCILSHGEKGVVLGTDGRPVPICELTQPFSRCSTLTGKPKLFFIQACQGNDLQEGVWKLCRTEKQTKACVPSGIIGASLRREQTKAMMTVRQNKVLLIRTLSPDAGFILQYVQQDNIITDREYNKLIHSNHTKEDIVTNLLDIVMNKGDATCCKFVDVLQRKEVQENSPGLQGLFDPSPTSHIHDNPIRTPNEGTKLQQGLWKHYVTEKDEYEDDTEKADNIHLPVEADFLIGMATVESYKSFRHTKNGSIYIQELCKHLKYGCPKKEDILTILTRVNRSVSTLNLKSFKQMPQPRYTLTNKLVLPMD